MARTRLILALLIATSCLAQEPTTSPATPPPTDVPGAINSATQTGTAQITGCVTSAETGDPIPQAQVTVRQPFGSPDWYVRTLTDKNGNYTVPWLPGGTMSIKATAPGFAEQTYQDPNAKPDTNTLISLDDTGLRADIDLRLNPAGTIHGTLLDTTGKPVENVVVYAYQQTTLPSGATSFQQTSHTLSGPDSHFIFDRLAPGVYRIVAGGPSIQEHHTAYRKTWLGDTPSAENSQTVEVHPHSDSTDLRILLTPIVTTYRLTVHPIWPMHNGEPANFLVLLAGTLFGDQTKKSAIFAGLPPDTYHVTVTAFENDKRVATGTATIEIKDANAATDVNLTPIP